MRLVTPKVYWISRDGLEPFLKDNGILWRPEGEESLVEFAGRLCYESWETEGGFDNKNLTKVRSGNKDYIGNILKQGHGSVLEHGGPLVFLFNNVSRVFTHEIVRHRIGTAFSQTSGRYVRGNDIKFWVPPSLEHVRDKLIFTVQAIENLYKDLEAETGADNLTNFSDKKKLTSALRRILPNGQANNILVSFNHRALRHIITMRTSGGAEEEIRFVIGQIAEMVKEAYPNIYQDMELQEDGSYVFKNVKV